MNRLIFIITDGGADGKMTFVIQVTASSEWKVKLRLDNLSCDDVGFSSFVPLYEFRRKICGRWDTFYKVLFPGYVFVATDDPEGFRQILKRIPDFAKLVEFGGEYVPISEEEEIYLRRLCGDDMIVHMSEGIIEGDKIIITDGPLTGREASVAKIDRHKRKAYIRIEMFGQTNTVQVGLEIIEKR